MFATSPSADLHPAQARLQVLQQRAGQVSDKADHDDIDAADLLADDELATGWVPDAQPAAGATTRWGRLVRRWVPVSVREAHTRPDKPSGLVLALVAAAAAALAAVGVWWSQPAPTQLPEPGPQLLPAAVSDNSVSTAQEPEARPGEKEVETADAQPAVVPPSGPILVSVTGRVQHPGLVTVDSSARVADAIAAAGGVLDDDDLTGLNLARILNDGDSVVVGGPHGSIVESEVDTDNGHATIDAGRVNINTADQTELETLPGVGPVTAQSILEWRQDNGNFTDVAEIQAVSGIGPATFARLVDLITT